MPRLSSPTFIYIYSSYSGLQLERLSKRIRGVYTQTNRSFLSIALFIITFISIFFLFYRLDSPLLWEDEGEVALIARNITKYGLPVAWDGEHFITQEIGEDSTLIGNYYLWSWNTWLPFYAVAVSFKLLGETTFAARFPFALAGLAILFFTHQLWKKICPRHYIPHLFGIVFLATNVIFYLYVRQARYYAFTILFSLSAFYFFLRFKETKKIHFAAGFFLSLLLSFHSNFVLSFGLSLPLLILPFYLSLLSFFKGKSFKSDIILAGCNALFFLQSFLWLRVFQPAEKHGTLGFSRYWSGGGRILEKVVNHVNLVNSFYFPWVVIILFFIFYLVKKRGRIHLEPMITLLILGSITHILVISIFLQFGQKYLLSLIPIASLLIAYICTKLYETAKILAFIIIVLFLFTNIPFLASERLLHPKQLKAPFVVRSYIKDYALSLDPEYRGSIEGIVSFFKQRGELRAAVYADYEVDSIKFYLPHLHFVDRSISPGGNHPNPQIPENFLAVTDFYIPRAFWGNLLKVGVCEREIIREEFIKHDLGFYDLEWNTLPDITYHKFRLDRELPPLIIYEKKPGVTFDRCKTSGKRL